MTRDNYEMKPRSPRVGAIFGADPQIQLRKALQTNDFTTFKKLVDKLVSHEKIKHLEHVYEYPDFKTGLELAVIEPKNLKFVNLLLEHKVEVNKINITYSAAPIHFAIENGNIDALKALLKDDRIDVNIKSNGKTALLMAINKIKYLDGDPKRDLDKYEEMVKVLLTAGCDANCPDVKDMTPVYSAAKQGLERVVTFIADYAKEPINLDSYKDIEGNTARYYIIKTFPHLLAKFESKKLKPEAIVTKLFAQLNAHEEDKFIRDFPKLDKQNECLPAVSAKDMNTMLQFATEKGFKNIVEKLLNSGADPNICDGVSRRPIEIACHYGHLEILKMLIDNGANLLDSEHGESLIQTTVKGMWSYYNTNSKADFDKCLELLMTHREININHSDRKDNTALHYAARNGDQDTVLKLLRNGASVVPKNKFNEPPLADINAKTLKTFLDECVTTNGKRPSDDDYEIHIKYSFLVYPNSSLENESSNVPLMGNSNNNGKQPQHILAPETDALLYMTQNEELRPLLKHPVITSFLYLKWQRISGLFYANLIFYSLLYLCLNLYIINEYGVEKKKPDSIEAFNVTITHVGAVIGLILLILRELFQLLVSPTRYLRSKENWMELILISVTSYIVYNDSAERFITQILSVVAIFILSIELLLLIGQFPTLSTNVAMLKKVTWTFFKFLMWYFILIVAFALSFYTLFRTEVDKVSAKIARQNTSNPNNTYIENEKEGKKEIKEDFFGDPQRSLFKTIIMSTGEFDTSSINFSTFPGFSHAIFILFVFMIPIILFNLLIGLAVDDTQEIRADAELVGHISRVKLISYYESVLIGNSRPSTWCTWLPPSFQNLNIIKAKMFCIKAFAKQISLFPHYLPGYGIIIKPNHEDTIKILHERTRNESDSRTRAESDKDIESSLNCCFKRFKVCSLDPKIVKNAKIIVSKNVTELDEIKTKIELLESILKEVIQKSHSDQQKETLCVGPSRSAPPLKPPPTMPYPRQQTGPNGKMVPQL